MLWEELLPSPALTGCDTILLPFYLATVRKSSSDIFLAQRAFKWSWTGATYWGNHTQRWIILVQSVLMFLRSQLWKRQKWSYSIENAVQPKASYPQQVMLWSAISRGPYLQAVVWLEATHLKPRLPPNTTMGSELKERQMSPEFFPLVFPRTLLGNNNMWLLNQNALISDATVERTSYLAQAIANVLLTAWMQIFDHDCLDLS